MGIFQIIKPSADCTSGIWEIAETEEDLLHKAFLSNKEKAFIAGIKAENRRKEWLASRVLLNELLEKPCQIFYNETGKPYITNRPEVYISISHTSGFAAVSINTREETGIDIQSKEHKISRIRHKFLCDDELSGISNIEEDEKLIIYWCAKEALYKLYGKKEVIFKEHLYIEPFELRNEGTMVGAIKKSDVMKNYLLYYKSFEGFVLVTVQKEI
ncbi:MAG: 4'-phosphopantetheinyl transferase superfamily protein [Bacteroidetes bacterium]|nr:4'-phosphopantetheinyl transferase superfamily protein [Bacteroidota bacterium]